jgi:hypothetical protein
MSPLMNCAPASQGLPSAPATVSARLDQRDSAAGGLESLCRGEASEAGTDDHGVQGGRHGNSSDQIVEPTLK